MTSLNLHPQQ